MSVQHISDPGDMARLAAQAVASGHGFAAELFVAARRKELACAFVFDPTAPAPMKALRRVNGPTIAVIGDDPGDDGLGPAAWLATRRLVEWANFAILHASGGTVSDYRLAVELTKLHGRLLLVECTTRHVDAWATELLGRKRPLPYFAVLPKDGQHPVLVRQEAAQQ